MTTLPDTIGPYEVIRPIAQGGMAEVFEVRDPETGERRALKLLMELTTSVKRFNREFEAMTRLNHPNIVRVYRYGFHNRHPWMSMELLRGDPLQVRVKAQGPPGTDERTSEVVRIAWFVANALQYIHDRGLVHRDLKSANVQVLADGRVKLLDFGTAHLIDPLEQLTQEGDFVGTFSYAAPEQIMGSKVDHRADLYALGVLLYRLLTGRRPFKASDPHKVAHMHLNVTPKPARELVPELPEALGDLIDRLLAKKKEDRPQSADDVAADLERIAGKPLTLGGFGLALYDDRSVGRVQELRQVWHAVAAAKPGHLVAVVGADEDERERMLDQLEIDAQRREFQVARVRAGADGASALAIALRSLVHGDDEPGRALLELLGAQEGLAEAHRNESAISAIPAVLARLRVQPGESVVLVDEVQTQDAGVVRALGGLLKHAQTLGTRIHLIASAHDPRSPGLPLLRATASDGTGLRLGPLDTRRTALAVGNLLHRRPPPPEAARRIQAATGGHPALIENVVRSMVQRGQLSVRDEAGNRVEWATEESDPSAFPPSVREALEQRLGSLPPLWRRVLEVVDVVGRRASPHQLAHATGVRQADLAVILQDMVEAGHIRWKGTAQHAVVPVDPLIVRFAGAAMRPHRRTIVQHLVADLVEKEPPAPAQVPLLVAVGRPAAALSRAVTCATELIEKGEVVDALQLLEPVLLHADRADIPAEDRISYHLLLAETVQRVKPMDARSVRSLETAAALAEGTPRAAEVKLGQAEQQRSIGHYANHRRYLFDAWDLIEKDLTSPLRPRVAIELGYSHVYGAQFSAARSWYDTALDAAAAIGDEDARDLTRIGIADIQTVQGRPEEALTALTEILEARKDTGNPIVRWMAAAAWGRVKRRLGHFSEAVAGLAPHLAEARGGESVPAWAALNLSAAECELDLYRLGRAQELVEEIGSALGAGERLHLRLEARLFQGRLELASGQYLTANFMLEEVVDQAEKAGLTLLSELGRAYLAEARWNVGAYDEARIAFQKAMLGLMSTGDLCSLADAIVSRARALGASEDPTKAFRLVRKLLSRSLFQPLYVEHLLAEVRWYRSLGEHALTRQSLREAQAAINRMAMHQGEIEQAAMRVHPWAHEITQCMQQLDALEAASRVVPRDVLVSAEVDDVDATGTFPGRSDGGS